MGVLISSHQFFPANNSIVLPYKIPCSFRWIILISSLFLSVDNELTSLKRFEETSEDKAQQVNGYLSILIVSALFSAMFFLFKICLVLYRNIVTLRSRK